MTGVETGVLAPFAAHVTTGARHARVRLVGELDVAAAARAEQAIDRAERAGPAQLELDLSGLSFMDSTGVRLLLSARQRALEAERRLLLRRGPDAVQRVLAVTALTELFEFVD